MSSFHSEYLRRLMHVPTLEIRNEGEFYVNIPDIPIDPSRIPLLFNEECGWFSEQRPGDKIYFEAYNVLPLIRLHNIKQLGFLSPINIPQVEFIGYHHRREVHSLIVARNFELVLRLNNFSTDIINSGIFAGLAHDIATPAGGDAVKGIDPEALDEEKYWKEVVTPEVQEFARKYEVDLDLVDDMIQGKGLLGEILSLVDRVSYTYVDTAEIHGIAAAYQLPKNPYRDIAIDVENGFYYFIDPYRFYDIFSARAMNHIQIYLDPINKGRDKLIQALIKPFYGRDGSQPLSPEVLRQIDDIELLRFIEKNYRFPHGIIGIEELVHSTLNNLIPDVEVFPPREAGEAQDFVKRVKQTSSLFYLGEEQLKGFDSGTSYLVKDYDSRRPIPFKDFYPDRAFILDSVAEACQGHCVYYVNLSSATEDMKMLISQLT